MCVCACVCDFREHKESRVSDFNAKHFAFPVRDDLWLTEIIVSELFSDAASGALRALSRKFIISSHDAARFYPGHQYS